MTKCITKDLIMPDIWLWNFSSKLQYHLDNQPQYKQSQQILFKKTHLQFCIKSQ